MREICVYLFVELICNVGNRYLPVCYAHLQSMKSLSTCLLRSSVMCEICIYLFCCAHLLCVRSVFTCLSVVLISKASYLYLPVCWARLRNAWDLFLTCLLRSSVLCDICIYLSVALVCNAWDLYFLAPHPASTACWNLVFDPRLRVFSPLHLIWNGLHCKQ